jgi:hypothetical protein
MLGAEELVYARGQLSVDEVQAAIAEFWQALDKPDSSALEEELSARRIGRAALADLDRTTAITVRAGASGADPISVVLLVTLAPSTNQIIKDLWTVVLARIRRRWGDDAVGTEKRSQD